MAKKNTVPIRIPQSFKVNIIDKVLAKKPRRVKTSRVMKGIENQFKKYPHLLKELEEAELK